MLYAYAFIFNVISIFMLSPTEIAEKISNFLLVENPNYKMYGKTTDGIISLTHDASLVVVNEVPEKDEYPYFEVGSIEDIQEVIRKMPFQNTEEESQGKLNTIIAQAGIDTTRPMYMTFKHSSPLEE
jgi:hypothetical protein